MIDLYSDTVTRPTREMRQFMCDAEVGDEQKHEDPTVNLLQEMVAELLGKDAALFLPSGTMCNEIALRVHCRPGDEMLAAAARIARGVAVPVTVDAEAGYGMEPAELVAALRSMGAAGCNLEDSDYAAGSLRDTDRHAQWLGAVRQAASEDGYPLVINARIDVFLHPFLAGVGPETQDELVPEALRRAKAYREAGVDCVFPIVLWERSALRAFISDAGGPVNVVRLPSAPSLAELAELGVARVSWGILLHGDAMRRFEEQLASLRD